MIDNEIDQCQPWPHKSQPAATRARAEIEHCAACIMDELGDRISDVANELAAATAEEFFRGQPEGQTPQWCDGASYVLAVVLSQLATSMSLHEMQEFTAELADSLAPIRPTDL